MMTRTLLLALALALVYSCAATGGGAFPGSIENLNRQGLGIQGYDPVAYFEEGGGAPTKGEVALTVEQDGATYRFASEANRELFLQDPKRYTPRYGGWCAWAMIDGERVEVDPESYLIEGDALYLFYDGWLADTRKLWLEKGSQESRVLADVRWSALSDSRDR